jgi:hypothetical protein
MGTDWSVGPVRIGQAGNKHPVSVKQETNTLYRGLDPPVTPDTSPILRRRKSFTRGMFRPTRAAEDLRLLLGHIWNDGSLLIRVNPSLTSQARTGVWRDGN